MKVGVFDTMCGNVERYQPYVYQFPELELIPFRNVHARDCMQQLKDFGCEAVIYTYFSLEPPDFFYRLAEAGIKYLVCVCVGIDALNIPVMEECGIRASNVPRYSPNSVAEHTVMTLLALSRNLRTQILNVENKRYDLSFPVGKEIREMTIGVVGAGRIGSVTINCLSGFHPQKIYAYTRHPSNRWEPLAEYADLETIYSECDAIIYHTDMNAGTFHLINRESIAKMKDGVILINPARGPVADTDALLEGIQSGKIGGLGIDVIEGENILKKDPNCGYCPLPQLEELLKYPNVLYTPHSAFYTGRANRDLAEITIDNLVSYARTGHSPNELTNLDKEEN